MRINCESVGFKNFLSFGSKWQDIPLKYGLNFVTGWDVSRNKSNGAGKSSFLESIIFALFGKTARDIKKEQIVNWKNKKNCEVVFRFSINDNQYEIMRSIKPDKLEVYKNGSLLNQDAHVKDYQSMFEEDIFGLDIKMFTSLVHSNTNSSANILSMKKPEKRKLMEKMFDLTVFSTMNEICNEKLRNIEGRTRETELKIQSNLEQIENAKKMIEQFKDEIKKKGIIEKELADLELEFKELENDYPNLSTEIENLSKTIEEKETKLRESLQIIDKKETEIKVKLEHVEKDIKEAKELDQIIESNKDLEDRIQRIENRAGTVDAITEHVEHLKESRKKLEAENDKNEKDYKEIEKEVMELKADLKSCEKNLELLKEGVCPVCGTKVENPKDHYGKEIASLKRKITAREKKMKPIDKAMEKVDKNVMEIDDELDTLQKAKENILTLKSQIKNVVKKDGLKIIEEKEKYNEALIKIHVKRKELNEKTAGEVNPIHNKWKDLNEVMTKIKNKEQELKDIRTQVKTEQKNIKSFEKMIEEQDSKADELHKKSIELSEGMKKFQTIRDYINAIKTLLKDENIKQHMIKRIMPYLNKQANYYLSEVDYSFYINIDKWLDIEIKGPGISNATYESLSGGERRGIDLAIQLGFLDIARTQAGIFPDLLTFDELLDSSIDGQGIGEVLKIVRVKQREANGKFFIISHRSEIDNELIDNRYHVVKENGYSRVEI